MYCKKTELLFEIQDKREVMIKTAKERGTIDEETIRLSQELDELIYEYQLVFRYENDNLKILEYFGLMLIDINGKIIPRLHIDKYKN